MSRLDSMHAFISRTIIIIVIPLSMRQSYAVVVTVIVISIVITGIIINIVREDNKFFMLYRYRNLVCCKNHTVRTCTYGTVRLVAMRALRLGKILVNQMLNKM